MDLTLNGYQLVSFCSTSNFPGASLVASQNGQTVPLGSVVLPKFTELGPNNQSATVDVLNGGVLKAGCAYWVFANTARGPVRLSFAGPSPSPSPSASPVPSVPGPAVASLQLTPAPAAVAVFNTIQFKLYSRSSRPTTRGERCREPATSSPPEQATSPWVRWGPPEVRAGLPYTPRTRW